MLAAYDKDPGKMTKFSSTTKGGCGQHGTTTPSVREYRRKNKQKIAKGKRNKKWTGWTPKTEEQSVEFRKKGDGKER